MEKLHLPSEDNAPCFNLIPITAGIYTQGSTDADASPYETPLHRVSLSTFAISEVPVTNNLFRVFTHVTGYITEQEVLGATDTWKVFATPDRDMHPVVLVSWNDAVAFCEWASESYGKTIALPTEAQWEMAARGGLEQKLFPWGNHLPNANTACWNRHSEVIGTAEVAQSPANAFGLFDMAGNVWEWCADWYGENYYAECGDLVENPTGPATGLFRVRRGASWNIGEPFRMRCANRGAMPPSNATKNIGFRIVINDL